MKAPASVRSRALRFTGALSALDAVAVRDLFDRGAERRDEVRETATRILERVRRDGDRALRSLARELDGVTLDALEIPQPEIRRALDRLDPAVRRSLERAARNLETAHAAFAPRASEVETEPGVVVGRRPDPFARAGLYAPGGRAAYPSSVLMAAIPARVAGVAEIVLCSPPDATGRPATTILAAAALTGVDRVFAVGGAGAIAAMAFGTESVPRVEAIAGPGNAYVAEAKLQVRDCVAIDSPAGPSELLVIADATADPESIAREMLAQAEHDPEAWALAVTTDAHIAERIVEALAERIEGEPRADVIRAALAARGGVLVAHDLDEALELANRIAPEHLMLAVADPVAMLARTRHAGAVFLGASSSVTFGDYLTGANHTLPTAGAGRIHSGLSTEHFVRWTSWQRVAPEAAARLAGDVATLAAAEGLPAHAGAARAWDDGERRTDFAPTLAARADYRDIPLYRPDLRLAPIALHDNTNRFGVPPAARRALEAAPLEAIGRYPQPYADDLKRALAAYAGVAVEAIVTGCGSDDVIDSAIRAFSAPGGTLAHCDPTFAMAPLFARMNGLTPVAVPLTPDLDLDVEALLATRAPVIYLCSPNNPTGGALSDASIERVVQGARGLVILDEAYAEFAGRDWIARAPRHPRLLVTRTLSKAFGLAGLRIGWGAAAPETAREVEKSRGPFKVGTMAVQAALAALEADRGWVRERVEELIAIRARFVRELEAREFAPLPTHANFVLVPVRDALALAQACRVAGVAVRPFPGLRHIGDAVRITIGPWREMEAALEALEAARAALEGGAPISQDGAIGRSR